MSTDIVERRRRGAALSSVGVNVGLLAAKVVVGVMTGSVALYASAADSLMDLAASVIAFLGVRVGGRPPDHNHAYGHHKFESLSSLAQLALLLVTVGFVVVEAIGRLSGEAGVTTPLAGVAVIAGSLVVDLWISRRLRRVAEETGGSQALEADALHFATDVWSNIAVMVGLGATAAGFPLGDPVAALVVAGLITGTALSLLRETAAVLTDEAPAPDVVSRLHTAIAAHPDVTDHHTLRARLVGSRIFLDVCVELDPELSFRRAHDVSHELQEALRRAEARVSDAVIHVEPAGHPPHQDIDHHNHGFDALS